MGGDSGLASHAARIGFAHAGALQQQQQHGQQHGHNVLEHGGRNQKSRIREVWKHNLHEEMANLRDLVDKYPYIAMVGHESLGLEGGMQLLTIVHRIPSSQELSPGRWGVPWKERLPLPMPPDQRRYAQDHSNWNHLI